MVVQKFILAFLLCWMAQSYACTPNIPDHIRKEYAIELQKSFSIRLLANQPMHHFTLKRDMKLQKKLASLLLN